MRYLKRQLTDFNNDKSFVFDTDRKISPIVRGELNLEESQKDLLYIICG